MRSGASSDVDLARVVHALGERVKELTALHETARLIQNSRLDTAQLLARVVELMPPAFQFPEITAARATYGEIVCCTGGFRETPRTLARRFETRDGTTGRLEVAYLEDRPAAAEGPFLVEERHLIDSIAEMLESALEGRRTEASLRRSEERLTAALTTASAERDRARLLLDVTTALVSALSLPDLLTTISQILSQTIPHHFASLTLWDNAAGQLRRQALVFPESRGIIKEGALVTTNRSPSRLVFDSGVAACFRWRDIQALGEPVVGIMAAEGLHSVCCIPLQTGRGRYGVLSVAKPTDEDFPVAERLLLEQITKQLSIAIENATHFAEVVALKERLTEEKLYLEDQITHQHDFKEIVGSSHALTSVFRQVRSVAPTDAAVLLLGETGTGKELLARAIHDASKRRTQTFVRINGAALPSGLVESELFGYEKGAFTGATTSKAGRLELANRGTLFLDEVGDISLEVQPKLLRALQEQEFERLGSTRTQRVDVRLIAATNRDLGEMVARGVFRSDLYYRLSVFPIVVPPLRERPDDIPFLVWHFVRKFSNELGRQITTIPVAAMHALQQWTWPGNIRELENVIERAVILSSGSSLQIPDAALQHPLRPPATDPSPGSAATMGQRGFDEGQRALIVKALRDAGGVIAGPNGAAARLGLKRTTLHAKMRRLGIARPSF